MNYRFFPQSKNQLSSLSRDPAKGFFLQLAKVLGTSPVLLPKKLKTKHLHVTDQCLATTELAREVALLRTNWE